MSGENSKQGLRLQKTINIYSSRLPDPPWTSSKNGVPDFSKSLYLLSQSAPPDLPHMLAGTALDALHNGRPWSDDEHRLVAALLDECRSQSKQTFMSFVRERRPLRGRGRPKSVRQTRRQWELASIGQRIDELVSQGTSQSAARAWGEQEFSLSRRAIDGHHANYKRKKERAASPEVCNQQRVDFREEYLSAHSEKRREYRDGGRRLRAAASLLKAAGSVLNIHLHMNGKSPNMEGGLVNLSIPPKDDYQCEALLSRKQSIHGGLLHCVSLESQRLVTKREIIVQWPEDTCVQRIVDEVVQMAADINDYSISKPAI